MVESHRDDDVTAREQLTLDVRRDRDVPGTRLDVIPTTVATDIPFCVSRRIRRRVRHRAPSNARHQQGRGVLQAS
jgi:hypothetical protein